MFANSNRLFACSRHSLLYAGSDSSKTIAAAASAAYVVGSRLGGLLLCERYLNNAVSLFVTLGLFGTFLGLSMSVSSLTELISLSNTSEGLSLLDTGQTS